MNTEFEDACDKLLDTLRENPEYSQRILTCLKEFFNWNYCDMGVWQIRDIESALKDTV